MTTNLLPRTRTFHRRRPLTAWWIAVGIAVLTNIALVVILSQISNLRQPLPAAPLTVRTLRQIEPETPPPLPPPETLEQPTEEVQTQPVLALPALELPSESAPTALTLPDMPKLAVSLDLPLNIPAFSAAKPSANTDQATLWPGPGKPDQSAQLESTFDLERFYPRAARLRGIVGQCRVRLTIIEDGSVLSVAIFESTPAGVFEQATRELARSLRFHPALVDGKAVASTKDLIIDWTLK
jgi:periplasmic protein TonB